MFSNLKVCMLDESLEEFFKRRLRQIFQNVVYCSAKLGGQLIVVGDCTCEANLSFKYLNNCKITIYIVEEFFLILEFKGKALLRAKNLIILYLKNNNVPSTIVTYKNSNILAQVLLPKEIYLCLQNDTFMYYHLFLVIFTNTYSMISLIVYII